MFTIDVVITHEKIVQKSNSVGGASWKRNKSLVSYSSAQLRLSNITENWATHNYIAGVRNYTGKATYEAMVYTPKAYKQP